MEDNKVHIKLEKQLLASEIKERNEKRMRKIIVAVLCFFFLLLGTGIGYLLKGNRINTSSGKLEEIKEYLENGWLYSNDYEDLDTYLDDKAYYGMTDFSDDPYTSYMSKAEFDEFASSINMNYVGVGVQYTTEDGVPTIIRVFKGSPAERFGLEVGDIIKTVDGVDITDKTTEEIKELVLGEEGTIVKFIVNRSGQDVEVSVERGAIETTAYAYAENDYVVLELMSFGESTSHECIRYLEDFTDYRKIIIDLRNNTGGYQNSVQEVAGLFLGKNQVVMDQIYNNGSKTTFKTISNRYFDNFDNIVILIDNYTASASEVLAICLKELHPNTTLVGETTYGKGVVQSNYILSDKESALKMTTSKWLSPNGVWVNGEGIAPDYEVFQHDVFYYDGKAMLEEDKYEYDDVKDVISFIQLGLDYLGYDLDRTDGYFDISFQEALKEFQAEFNLEVNGILDYQTYQTVLSRVTRLASLDKSYDNQFAKAVEIISQ